MSMPRIYADFNAIEHTSNTSAAEMPLTGYGTLASLARQKLRLTEGMALLLFEPNDIECEVTVHFDRSRNDPAGRIGEWVARFDPRKIQDRSHASDSSSAHPCIVCGHDFAAVFLTSGRHYTEVCAGCGASVMEPLAPPKDAT